MNPSLLRTVARIIIVATIGGPFVCAQGTGKLEPGESDRLVKIQHLWTDLADFAMARGVKTIATDALDAAEKFGATAKALEYPREKLAKVTPLNADAAAGVAVEAKQTQTKAAVTVLLDELAKMDVKDTARARFEGYLWSALDSDPENKASLALIGTRLDQALKKKDVAAEKRILARAMDYDAAGLLAGKYVAAEAAIGRDSMLLLKGPGHILQALVLLPPGWNDKQQWPVCVYVDGAGSNFDGAAKTLRALPGAKAYIVVVPFTLANTNELDFKQYTCYPREKIEQFASMQTRPDRLKWDVAGLDAVLGQVRGRFRGESKMFLTGYSGGGNVAYWWLHHRPQDLWAVAPCSCNYAAYLQNDAVPPQAGGPPVLLITGEKDYAGVDRIFPQSEEAMAALRKAGFASVERHHLPGRQHEAFSDLAFEILRSGSQARAEMTAAVATA